MTELKQSEIEFVNSNPNPSEESDAPVFKLKVTNLRKSAYPTIIPTESDLFKFKVGDFICKQSGNAVFQVVSMIREPLCQDLLDRFNKRSQGYRGYNEVQRAKELLDEYQKNGNFGVCKITIKPLLRGSKEITKGKLVKFFEIEQIRSMTYNAYAKVNLTDLIKTRGYWISSIQTKIKNLESRLNTQVTMRDAIQKLLVLSQQTQLQVTNTFNTSDAPTTNDQIDQVDIAA